MFNPLGCKPNPQSLSAWQRYQIIHKRSQGKSYRTIADEMELSRFVVYKYLHILRDTSTLFSDLEHLSSITKKQKHKATKIDKDGLARVVIRKALALDPQCYLKEYCKMLADKIDFHIKPNTLGKWLKQNKISCKKVIKIAIETDELEAYLHNLVMRQIITNKKQWVTGDESNFDERDLNRLFGWGERYRYLFAMSVCNIC